MFFKKHVIATDLHTHHCKTFLTLPQGQKTDNKKPQLGNIYILLHKHTQAHLVVFTIVAKHGDDFEATLVIQGN